MTGCLCVSSLGMTSCHTYHLWRSGGFCHYCTRQSLEKPKYGSPQNGFAHYLQLQFLLWDYFIKCVFPSAK